MAEKRVSDAKLVELCKKGSMEAFEEIVSRYESKAFNLAMRFVRSKEDAEEVLQDVFVTLYRKISGFEGKSAFSSWLYRIIVNAAYMKLRKRRQEHAVAVEDIAAAARHLSIESDHLHPARSDTITMGRELGEALEGAINRLPGQYRAVFILRDVDGLSNQEVGEILNISIPAVKSRLHRSRLMLRRKLQRTYDEYVGRGSDPTPRVISQQLAR